MPATSKAQRQAMAIAEHHPGELYARNKGMAKMTHGQLHDFAATSEKHLPERAHEVRHSNAGSEHKAHHSNREAYFKRNAGGREHP